MANLTASGSAPTVTWADVGDDNLRIRADGDVLTVAVEQPSWQSLFEWRTSESVSTRSLELELAAPKIDFTETTSDALSAAIEGDDGIANFTLGTGGAKFLQLQYVDADDRAYVYGPQGISAGHGATDGTANTIGVKHFDLGLNANPYTWDVFDEPPSPDPIDIMNDLVGVIVMVSNRSSPAPPLPITYQVLDARSAAAAKYFYLEAKRADGGEASPVTSPKGDQFIITRDVGQYPNGSRLLAICFYRRQP